LSIAFDKKREKKFGMRLKTIVTLHRLSDKRTILRQKNRFLDKRTKEHNKIIIKRK
jgi:hypothetical protein